MKHDVTNEWGSRSITLRLSAIAWLVGCAVIATPNRVEAQNYGPISPSSYQSLTPMTRPVAYEDERGVRLGDLLLHGGLSAEAGYDSNVHQEDSTEGVDAGLIFHVMPSVRLLTPDPRNLRVSGILQVLFEFFVMNDDNAVAEDGLDINGNFQVQIGPRGIASLTLYDVIRNQADSSLSPNNDNRRHLYNELGAIIDFHPGGAERTSRLGFTGALTGGYAIDSWDEELYLDRQIVSTRLELKYHFLPKTALFINGSWESISYDTRERPFEPYDDPYGLSESFADALTNIDSTTLTATGGLSGLLTQVIDFQLSGGYASSTYEEGESFDGLIANIQLGLFFTPKAHLTAGWERGFADSSYSNYYDYDRFSASLEITQDQWLIGGRGSFENQNFSALDSLPEATVGGELITLFEPAERVDPVMTGTFFLSYNTAEWMRISGYYNVRSNITDFVVTNGLGSGTRDNSLASRYVKHRIMLAIEFEY